MKGNKEQILAKYARIAAEQQRMREEASRIIRKSTKMEKR